MRTTLTLAAILILAAPLLAQEAEPVNKLCPVMVGEKVDPEIYVDHEGKRVWLCCDVCVEDFQADPEKYYHLLPQFGGSQTPGEPAPAEAAPVEAGETGGTEETAKAEDHRFGALHPMLVHFPVALTFAALFAGLLTFVSPRFRGIALFCIVFAAVLSVPAFLVGEQAEEAMGRMSESRHETVEAHKLWGTISMYTLLGVALVNLVARFKPDSKGMWLFAFLLLLGAAAVVGYTGYLGGEVVRPGHLDALMGK
jgi:uncharacterized membrane protein